MRCKVFTRKCLFIAIFFSAAAGSHQANSQTVWSGLTKSFTKADGADGSLPANQDTLTPNVIIARGSSGGIYNAETEPNYLGGTSPEFTEWATDLVLGNEAETISAANWANLQFTDWIDAYGGAGSQGLNLAGRDAVVHLVNDDIYLDLRFTSWTNGHQFPSGGFSYMRAQPPGPTGDYNGDHVVDAADYTVWRDNLGHSVPNGTGADGNNNGTIDSGDYDFWKAHFGNPAGAGSAASEGAAVPEPGTILLSILGTSLLMAFRARFRVFS